MDVKPPTTKAAQSEATRTRLLAAARALFAEHGYAGVGTEEIVREAGVTRGALYHQFADKQALFRAVFEAVEEEIIVRAGQQVAQAPDPLAGLRAGFLGWLDAAADPAVQRIVLVDAPAVLGWEEWRAIGMRYGMGATTAALQHAMDAGAIAEQPVAALSHAMVGALDEAAMYVARADDQATARADMELVLDRLVQALRP
jgi:AcrR family transcriptional regulator